MSPKKIAAGIAAVLVLAGLFLFAIRTYQQSEMRMAYPTLEVDSSGNGIDLHAGGSGTIRIHLYGSGNLTIRSIAVSESYGPSLACWGTSSGLLPVHVHLPSTLQLNVRGGSLTWEEESKLAGTNSTVTVTVEGTWVYDEGLWVSHEIINTPVSLTASVQVLWEWTLQSIGTPIIADKPTYISKDGWFYVEAIT